MMIFSTDSGLTRENRVVKNVEKRNHKIIGHRQATSGEWTIDRKAIYNIRNSKIFPFIAHDKTVVTVSFHLHIRWRWTLNIGTLEWLETRIHDRSLAIYIYLLAKRRTQQTATINFIFVMCSTTVHLSCEAVLAVSLSACAGLQVSKRHYETHRLSSVVTACRVSAADERGGEETRGGWRDCGIEREINCFGIYYTQCDCI